MRSTLQEEAVLPRTRIDIILASDISFAIRSMALVLLSIPLALAGLALSYVHPVFALLAVSFCALVSLRLYATISRVIFKK
jgi:hypothetical protein